MKPRVQHAGQLVSIYAVQMIGGVLKSRGQALRWLLRVSLTQPENEVALIAPNVLAVALISGKAYS